MGVLVSTRVYNIICTIYVHVNSTKVMFHYLNEDFISNVFLSYIDSNLNKMS